MELLEYRVRAVTAGVGEVETRPTGTEATSFAGSETLQSSHVTNLDGFMKTYLNPGTLAHNPAFSQAIVVEGPAKTIYVGGQNAVAADGTIVGDTLAEQSSQAIANVQAALAAAGATLHDVVRWTVAIVQGQSLRDGFAAFQAAWGDAPDPPTVTVYVVAGLANPRFLIEIDAIAAC